MLTIPTMTNEKKPVVVGFRPDAEALRMLDEFRQAQVATPTVSATVTALFKLGFEQWAKARDERREAA